MFEAGVEEDQVSCSLNPLKGVGDYVGEYCRGFKRDARSVDYSSSQLKRDRMSFRTATEP